VTGKKTRDETEKKNRPSGGKCRGQGSRGEKKKPAGWNVTGQGKKGK